MRKNNSPAILNQAQIDDSSAAIVNTCIFQHNVYICNCSNFGIPQAKKRAVERKKNSSTHSHSHTNYHTLTVIYRTYRVRRL